MGTLVIIAALVLLFPIGWLVSKTLYQKLVVWIWVAWMVVVISVAVWSLTTGQGVPRMR